MNTVEAVQCFSINLSRALDFHEHIEAFSLADERYHPTDVGATNTVFGAHLAICALLATAATNVPVSDFEVCWHDVVDVHVLQCSIAVVFEQNQDFIAAFAANW